MAVLIANNVVLPEYMNDISEERMEFLTKLAMLNCGKVNRCIYNSTHAYISKNGSQREFGPYASFINMALRISDARSDLSVVEKALLTSMLIFPNDDNFANACLEYGIDNDYLDQCKNKIKLLKSFSKEKAQEIVKKSEFFDQINDLSKNKFFCPLTHIILNRCYQLQKVNKDLFEKEEAKQLIK